MFDLLILNTSEVITANGPPSREAQSMLAAVPGGAVGVKDGRIAFIGPESQLTAEQRQGTRQRIDARGGFVGPGFVDPHTHLIFGGERSREFELRNRGATYLEIAEAGGGIANTVRATRAASVEELVALARPRALRLLRQGVTTVEVKSGYGLSTEHERKMLQAAQRLAQEVPLRIVPTLLCAHAIPEEHRNARERYVALCADEIIPAIGEEKLARFCDVFTDQGAFSIEESRRILEAGRKAGLVPRLHADQLAAIGASELAAEVGASSADHLEQVTDRGIAALAAGDVSAVLVPVSTLFLRMRPYAPGRRLWDAGVNVALGTNVNPGSAMSENHALTLGLACLENGLSPAEAYYAATRGAARALRLDEAGVLRVGAPADLVVFAAASFRHLPYHLAVDHARVVVMGGRVVAEAANLDPCP